VSTTRENSARSERLDSLVALLPQERPLRWIAEQLSDGVETKLGAKLRGELVATDEMAMRSLEEKLARQLGTAAPLNRALEILNEESASWRLLEGSTLANRLIADHGFADTYGQARKRARTLLKDQAAGGRNGPKARDVKALLRWHDSLEAQLGAVASATKVSPEFRDLQNHLSALRTLQCRWLGLARLGRVPGLKEAGSDSLRQTLVDTQKRLSVKLLMSLQRCYGPSKSNFRGLIESELA